MIGTQIADAFRQSRANSVLKPNQVRPSSSGTYQMTIERKIAQAFQMSNEAWLRHTNPWSGWTRFTALPFLILSIWSRVWLGWWSLFPISLVVLWIWLNPHVFPKPQSTNHWMSKGVLGERVWLNRDQIAIPKHHQTVPNILNGITTVGGVLIILGLIKLHIWIVIFGYILVTLGKLWFIDRMVWLYSEMKDYSSEYRSWLY